ncbi:hypothetical protein DD238_008253 [Peronospora effusa]|uniref:Uncharacterized protein n=1 Tax=Peronospora effusa TaxID=542832 RepID=A0A3M6VFC0_9STRA|nr:hypothetical protein DD238_008253 [Peronospora effusa]
MATTVKKCLKLHKLFVAEVTRNSRLESEGSQVLSTLANVSQRVPTLLQYDSTNGTGNGHLEGNVETMGVLTYSSNTQALLLQKHFLTLEKSLAFLSDIMRDFQELLRHLRSFASECVVLVDDALLECETVVSVDDEMAVVTFPLQLQEWMETVLAMFEHEVLRKVRLVTNLEYSDPRRLNAVHKQWSSKGVMGNVDYDYVQTGLQLPQVNYCLPSQSSDSKSITSESKRKKKTNKANK